MRSKQDRRDQARLEREQNARDVKNAAASGALGGMVKSKGQHGKGKLVADDPLINELKEKHGDKPEKMVREAKKELRNLSEQAKKEKSAKARNKILKRKDALKGAIKLLDRYLIIEPLMITPFTKEQIEMLYKGIDPKNNIA